MSQTMISSGQEGQKNSQFLDGKWVGMQYPAEALVPVDLVKMEQPPRYKLRSLHDALQPLPPIQWVIKDLISAGTVNIIFGEPGCGKTWLYLDMLMCIATGSQWIGMETTQSPVLVVDEDTGERGLAERLAKVARGHEAKDSTPLYYVSLSQFNLTDVADQAELEYLIETTGAKVVVVDTLASVILGRDENSVKDIQPLFSGLRGIAERRGVAIILVHHANKNGSRENGNYRGSSAMKGAVDLMLMVSKENESDIIDVKTVKARNIKATHFSAEAHFEDIGMFYLSEREKSMFNRKLSKTHEYLIRYLFNNNQSTIEDIEINADVCSSGTARRELYRLVDPGMGYVQKDSNSTLYGRGARATYSLTEKGRDYAVSYRL